MVERVLRAGGVDAAQPVALIRASEPARAVRLARRHRIVFAGLLAAAAALRLGAAAGDLWLDEIWSLAFIRELHSAWQVLWAIHHDNNHILNSLALFLTIEVAGVHAPAIAYRVLPLVTGIAIIPLLFWTEGTPGDRNARARAWLAACLAAGSFAAVVYSSEARGYAPAAFFAVAAFALIRRAGQQYTPGERLTFAGVCALGILSHLTFLFPYAGLLAWTLRRAMRSERFPWSGWIVLHALPIAVIAGYYLIDVRFFSYGGGPPFHVPEVLSRTLAFAVGGPNVRLLRDAAALACLAAVIWGICDLVRRGNDEAVFFAVALFVAPAGVLLFYRARFLDSRYFFVLFPFVWLLAARALAAVRARGAAGRHVATALIVLSASGSLFHIAPLLRDGRGRYGEAVARITALTPGREITVGGGHDFHNRMLLGYYFEKHAPDRTFVYVPADAWTPGRPEWVITESHEPFEREGPPVQQLAGSNRDTYSWVQSFRCGGTSGWNWHVYRLVPKRTPNAT